MATITEQGRVQINRDKHFTHQQKRTQRALNKLYGDSLTAAVSTIDSSSNSGGNYLISGGAVWDTGLVLQVNQCVYVIEGNVYTSETQSVTLTAADPTNPRIDVIVVDDQGVASVVTGTAAATPVKPEINALDEVEVTFVTVAATGTTPDAVTDTVIYDEDDDWTTAVSNARIVAAATDDPYNGTKHVSFNAAQDGDYISFTTTGADLNTGDVDAIKLYINPTGIGTRRKDRLQIGLFNGTTRVSNWVDIRHGSFGFNADAGDYHLVGIPMPDFGSTGEAFAAVHIRFVGGSTLSCEIDDIDYQSGVTATDLSAFAKLAATNVFTKAQASSIVVLTDAATITCDLSRANVFDVTLDGNRTMDFTNPIAGQHFTLFVRQDGVTGSRTITWDAAVDWAAGVAPSLSTGVNDVDVLTFVVDAAGNIHGSLGIANSS
jgi:hypothetical protein